MGDSHSLGRAHAHCMALCALAVLTACDRAGGAGRSPEIVSCTPGFTVTVGCGAEMLGACSGDPVILVCDGAGTTVEACDEMSSAFVAGSDDADGFCPGLSLTCPPSGTIAVRPSPFAGGAWSCDWQTREVAPPAELRFPPRPSSVGILTFEADVFFADVGAELVPGLTAQAHDGTTVASPSVAIAILSGPEVLGATADRVRGLSPGVAEIAVAAPGFASDRAFVVVGTPSGTVVGVSFRDVAMRVGDRVALASIATAYGPTGAAIDLASVTFNATGALSLEGDTVVAGSAGAGALGASSGGLTLPGGLRVVVGPAGMPPAAECDWGIVPARMWTGMASGLRPIVRRPVERPGGFWEFVADPGTSELELRGTSTPVVSSALGAEFVGFNGAVSFAATGDVVAVRAGWIRIDAGFDFDDDTTVLCNPYVLEVAESPDGDWTYTCENGTEGLIRGTRAPTFPTYGDATRAVDRPEGFVRVTASGTDAVVCKSDGERCEGSGALVTVGPGFVPADCATDADRGGGARERIQWAGPRQLIVGACTFNPGSTEPPCARPDAGTCEEDPLVVGIVYADFPEIRDGLRADDAWYIEAGETCTNEPRYSYPRPAHRNIYPFYWEFLGDSCERTWRRDCEGREVLTELRCAITDQHGNQYETDFSFVTGTGVHRWRMNPDCWRNVDGEAELRTAYYVCGDGECSDICAGMECSSCDRGIAFLCPSLPPLTVEECSSDCTP